MMIPLLLTLAALQPQQEQQLQRQQQQVEQVQRQLQEQQQQLGRLLDALDREIKQEPPKPVCSAELRWVVDSGPRKIPASTTAVVALNLFSVVSEPAAACLPAEVRVTASYLDAKNNLICSGVIENAAAQTALTQSINLEVRPGNLREFGRWRNEPPQINSGSKRLSCVNADGLAEASSEELARVTSVRVHVTALPQNSGMSTAEVQIDFQR